MLNQYSKISTLFVIGLMTAVLAACGDEQPTDALASEKTTTTTTTSAVSETYPQTEEMPATEGVLRVATTGQQPPFSFMDERGNLQGIDIDVMMAIGKAEGLKMVFFAEPWFSVPPSVAAGKRDIAVSGISYNDERNENYALSTPYLFVPSAIMVMEESGINGVSDLAGKKFSCMTAAKQCGDIARLSPTTTVEELDSTFVSFQHLVQGKTSAIGEDLHLLQHFSKNHPNQKVKIIPYETENDPPAQQIMMMAKGNEALMQRINGAIAKLKASGELARIEQKWMR